jgi:hypothetical protein
LTDLQGYLPQLRNDIDECLVLSGLVVYG